MDTGVIWNVPLELLGVGLESRHKGFHRIKQKVARGDKRRNAAGFSTADPALDGDPFEARMTAQQSKRQIVRYNINLSERSPHSD